MQNGRKVYMDCYMASNGSSFMVTWIIFKTTSWRGITTKPGDHGTPNAHNRWFVYSILSYARSRMNRNAFQEHLVDGPVTCDFTLHLRVREHTTSVWRCVGTAFGHFSFGLSQLHGHGSCLVCEGALR